MEDKSSVVLEINQLEIEFHSKQGNTKAVKGIDLSLMKGETLGIAGESGSGKSVTSLAIMGLLPPKGLCTQNGSIKFEGKEILKLSEKEFRSIRAKEISMIFQEPMTSLNPVHRCGSQVMEVVLEHMKVSKKEAKKMVLELFEKVQLPRPDKIFKAYPHQISGGQKQRVMISMAIACKPKILIADEPTTALDVTVQKEILELLNELKLEMGMSMIFITHDLGVLSQISDRILIMRHGEILEKGSPRKIFQSPSHHYTKGLIACLPSTNTNAYRLSTVDDYFNPQETSNTNTKSSNILSIEQEKPLLQVEDLSTWFPSDRSFTGKVKNYVKAVDKVNLEVYKGETLGLVGESGCGKTTLGRTVLKMIPSTGGLIVYDEIKLNDLHHKELRKLRKRVQIIFQDPYSSLNPRKTIGGAILEPMKVHGIGKNRAERKRKVEQLLEKVGLNKSHYHRYPHEFSGGQRQRIGIARALAVEPEFIICDESVSALDVSVQAQVLNLLNDLKEEYGFTYIFISHDLSVVKYMSDRIAVMKDGQIEELGTSDDIFDQPKSDYTKKLFDAILEVKV